MLGINQGSLDPLKEHQGWLKGGISLFPPARQDESDRVEENMFGVGIPSNYNSEGTFKDVPLMDLD